MAYLVCGSETGLTMQPAAFESVDAGLDRGAHLRIKPFGKVFGWHSDTQALDRSCRSQPHSPAAGAGELVASFGS